MFELSLGLGLFFFSPFERKKKDAVSRKKTKQASDRHEPGRSELRVAGGKDFVYKHAGRLFQSHVQPNAKSAAVGCIASPVRWVGRRSNTAVSGSRGRVRAATQGIPDSVSQLVSKQRDSATSPGVTIFRSAAHGQRARQDLPLARRPGRDGGRHGAGRLEHCAHCSITTRISIIIIIIILRIKRQSCVDRTSPRCNAGHAHGENNLSL